MTIIDDKGIIKAGQINITNHCYERMQQRIDKNMSRTKATEIIAEILNKGSFLDMQDKGKERYSKGNRVVVIDKFLNAVTYLEVDSEWERIAEAHNEIDKYIINKLKREVKPLRDKIKENTIEILNLKVSYLNTKSNKTKGFIKDKVELLENDNSRVNDKIEKVLKYADHYRVDRNLVYVEDII